MDSHKSSARHFHYAARNRRYGFATPRQSSPRARILWAVFLPILGISIYKAGGYLAGMFNPPDAELNRRKVVENPIQDEEWRNMVAALGKIAGSYNGRVGIYLKDLHSERTWEYNPDRIFPSASLIKVPIMAAVLEKVKRGELSLDTQIKLTRRYRAGGSGSLKWAREGTKLSVTEIVYKMITESDNTATKMLVDYVGMDYFQRAFKDLGFVHTRIYPEGMSLSSRRVARENYTTAREMTGLMERIYNGEVVDRASSAFMLDVLKRNKSRTRLRKGLPMGWEIGHKTGLLRRSCHDVGIVFSPRGDYLIAVLTGDVPSYSSAKKFIARIAKLTYKYYRIDSDYAQSRAISPGPANRSEG